MRLFIAIQLSDEVKTALRKAQRMLAAFDRVVRWLTPEQMHLTLKFLGEVENGAVTEVSAAADLAAEPCPPFEMVIAGAGCFPPRGRVRIVWAGIDEPSGALAAYSEQLEERCAEIGFERERRPFSPHLTVGRVREDPTGGRLRQAVEQTRVGPVSQRVDALCVFQSTLKPQGAEYAIVSRHPLRGALD